MPGDLHTAGDVPTHLHSYSFALLQLLRFAG